MGLKEYRKKRTFKNTPEPTPAVHRSGKELHFSVQKHAASHLHYDFRLEHKGVLLSWAIPKGPSLDPNVKRLAMHVEDHPYDYRTFEGIIPAGNYGAGTVLLWDEGLYTVPGTSNTAEMEKLISAGMAKGHLEFVLHGHKLKGAFSLIKLKTDEKSWLLIKKRDGYESPQEVTQLDYSVKKLPKRAKKHDKMPADIQPMLATLVQGPFDDENWLFETKWDGYRAISYISQKGVEIRSRNQLSFNKAFPTIVENLQQISADVILDGEIVALDPHGKSSFQLMQNYQHDRTGDLKYCVFDLLFHNGEDLRNSPLVERKQRLKELLVDYSLPCIYFTEHVEKQGVRLFKEAEREGLEGIIGKRSHSVYISKRSSDWVKIKTHQRQEAVIGGFSLPKGGRKYFGSLLLGVYRDGKLHYIGHSGGGFDEQTLRDIYQLMEPLKQDKSPFINPPKGKDNIWIKPKLVCEVSFTEWTSDEIIRHPIFEGMRLDKKAAEVVKEIAQQKINKPISKISNPEKVYWPEEQYTKQDLVDYYKEVSRYILPYLKNRPMILHRYPEGISGGKSFYQKDTSMLKLPDYVETVPVQHEDKIVTYIMIQNEKTLLDVVNMGNIEMHPFLSQAKSLDRPDFLVVDLDPEDIDFNLVVKTAQTVHSLLDDLEIPNFCKTSGGRGLHIYIPLKGKYTFEQIKLFREILANLIHRALPEITSLERHPAKRQKKVYIDVLQNNPGQSIASPYSVRAKPHAPVSTPLKWSEVKKGLNPLKFTIKTVPARLKKVGDLFAPLLRKAINIEKVLKKLEKAQKKLSENS